MVRSRKSRKCPRCGSTDVLLQDTFSDGVSLFVCADCDHDFEAPGSRRKAGVAQNDKDDELDDILPDFEHET